VKVDAKTKSLLDEHKRKKKDAQKDSKKDSSEAGRDAEEEGETKGSDDDDDDEGRADVDGTALQGDVVARTGLHDIMNEYADDLRKELPAGELFCCDFCLVINFMHIVNNNK